MRYRRQRGRRITVGGVRRAATAWSALADRPWRFLASAWPWRSFAYVVSSPFVALAVLAGLIGAVVAGIMLSPVWIGIVVLYSLPVLGVGVGTPRALADPAHAGP